jgi:hypothetical protein
MCLFIQIMNFNYNFYGWNLGGLNYFIFYKYLYIDAA